MTKSKKGSTVGEGAGMTLRQAARIAVAALDERAQRLAVSANLYDLYGLETGEKASIERAKIKRARAVIMTELGQKAG